MSLEIEINTLAANIKELTTVVERLIGAQVTAPAAPPAPAAAEPPAPAPEPAKRPRRTKAEIEAEEAAKKAAEAAEKAAAAPAPAPEPVKEEDPFADAFGDAFDEPAPKVYTEAEVHNAFIDLAKTKGRDVAVGILKLYSTTNLVTGIPADKYTAVMADIAKAKG